jgi:hypothetical protein
MQRREKSSQRRRMKTLKPILIIICLVILCGPGCGRSVMTNDQVMARFEKAGGVDAVNKEAEVIFSVFGSNGAIFLQDHGVSALRDYPEIITNHPEVKSFPAIFSLGDFVMLLDGATNEAPEIIIKYGTHRDSKTIEIFPPNLEVNRATNFQHISTLLNDSSYFHVTNNIFAWKGRY